jgi:hypothetical protein
MGVLSFLAEAFIGFFGITEPGPKQRKLVHLVIGGFLLGVILFVLALGTYFFVQLRAGR